MTGCTARSIRACGSVSPRATEMTLGADLSWRLAEPDDLDALRALMRRAIEQLQQDFLTPEQVRASHGVMGLDTQLIRDRTYFLVQHGDMLAGCGGWSFRATLFGGDDSVVARTPQPLDPAHDAARVRAMYTDPAFTRQGVGRLILSLCEDAARARGFRRAELMATMAGMPLYRACGYEPAAEPVEVAAGEVKVPLCLMAKALD